MGIVAQPLHVSALLTPHSGPDLPAPSDDARRDSVRLTETIRKEIEAGGGRIDFARFMELALYAPGQGYYVAGAAKLGGEGDFVTAPEISPLFARTLARQIAELLERTGGDVLELGGGSGILATDLLLELRSLDRLPRRYLMLEISPQLAQRQQSTIERRLPELATRIEWLTALPENFEGVVIANEVLDALPVHLVAWRQDGLYERGVGWKDGFVWSERPLPPGALRDAAEAAGVEAETISEISLAAPALVRTLSGALRKGALLLIDYGFGRREYYHPQRSRGTLMCHYRHRAHDDPFFLPGLQDLTAHVDFTVVAEAGIDAGLKLLGYTTQAQFLINSGITQLLEQQSEDAAASRFALTAGVQKLLSPAEMGELFKVIALGRGICGPLIGFASGDKSRLL
jgi:SAM-dependent MidA family methyltransferase